LASPVPPPAHRGPTVWITYRTGGPRPNAAEAVGLTILHCDKDFELIAGLTRQPLCRLI
jgi:hypothetical protein